MKLVIPVQLFALVFIACASAAAPTATSTKLPQTPTPLSTAGVARQATPTPESKLTQRTAPLWRRADSQDAMEKLQRGQFTSYVGFLKDPDKKPPLYKDPRPLEYVNYYGDDPAFPAGPYSTGLQLLIAQEFKGLGFMNVFVSGTLGEMSKGAVTFRQGGGVAAEARLLRYLEDNNQKFTGLELEEVHYGRDGKPVFECKSQFDERFYKVNETEVVGKKLGEYYFMWPDHYMR